MQRTEEKNEMPKVETITFDGMSLRVVFENEDIFFIASDILKGLELDRKALERIDESEKGVKSIHTLGGTQQMVCLTESALYDLILGSRVSEKKPQIKAFKKWVTRDVLPTIRKTGKYEMPQEQPQQADEDFDENENAFSLEGATLKLNYETEVAKKLIQLIDDCFDARFQSFRNLEMNRMSSVFKHAQNSMETRIMGYIQDLFKLVGKQNIDKEPQKPTLSYVYLMENIDALSWLSPDIRMCKIGKANIPDERKFELELGGAELRILDKIGFPSEELAYAWEKVLKETFALFVYRREWFLLGEAQIDFFRGLARLFEILYGKV